MFFFLCFGGVKYPICSPNEERSADLQADQLNAGLRESCDGTNSIDSDGTNSIDSNDPRNLTAQSPTSILLAEKRGRVSINMDKV